MTLLRRVLETFEQSNAPLSTRQMARQLDVEPAILDDMIAYWIRKGKLREAAAGGCESCGIKSGCTLVLKQPRRYELATGETPEPPPCACCH